MAWARNTTQRHLNVPTAVGGVVDVVGSAVWISERAVQIIAVASLVFGLIGWVGLLVGKSELLAAPVFIIVICLRGGVS